jgi:hypothetical protein
MNEKERRNKKQIIRKEKTKERKIKMVLSSF